MAPTFENGYDRELRRAEFADRKTLHAPPCFDQAQPRRPRAMAQNRRPDPRMKRPGVDVRTPGRPFAPCRLNDPTQPGTRPPGTPPPVRERAATIHPRQSLSPPCAPIPPATAAPPCGVAWPRASAVAPVPSTRRGGLCDA